MTDNALPQDDKDVAMKTPVAPTADPSETMNVSENTIVFHEGDVSDFAYMVIEGHIELTKNIKGAEIFLAEISVGDLFGEMGMIDGNVRSATATAIDDVVLQRISHEGLMQRLNDDSDFAAPVLMQLVGQLRATSDRMAHEQVLSLERAADAADVIEDEGQGPLARLRNFFNADADMIEFQPDAVEIERRHTPAVAKIMLYTIFFFIVGIFTWASVSTIDTAVSAVGRMTTEVPNIVVQPSETALIKSILVREGQTVEKGDILATLDATVAQSDVNVSRASLISIAAQERRLIAETNGETAPGPFSDDPAVNKLQTEVFKRRQASVREKLISFDEQVLEIEAAIETNVQDGKDLEQQAEVLRELEAMRSKLLDDGHGSRVNYLSAKHQRLSVDREQRRLVSDRARMAHQLKALRSDREAAASDWRSRTVEELVETRRERERLSGQLKQTEHRESLINLVAPAPGIILKIAERSVGSVIQQAEQMFTIVPADVPMELEADVLPRDVGLIQVGDIVRIKLDALPFQKHGVIEGRVRLISEDAVDTGRGGATETVYRSRIELLEPKLRDVPDSFRLTPGLTGSADITVGKRRIITYFIYPLVRAFDSSFREP